MTQSHVVVSQMDQDHLAAIRQNVVRFLALIASRYLRAPGRLLDIAPQDHTASRPNFPAGLIVETLDIDPNAGCTYTGDITKHNAAIPDGHFDYIICTEVLEHTLQPFDATDEMWRMLGPGGYVFASTPFNFRIHGPLPDCWRFTEHGLRALFSRYNVVSLDQIATPTRDLMPIHYTLVARKPE